MTDYLASLSAELVAAWYRRLADRIAAEKIGGREPLASQLLRHWLDNRDSKSVFSFDPPDYLRNSPYVTERLAYHRRVFLSQEKAQFSGGRQALAGVLPRLERAAGFPAWNLEEPLVLTYESLVEVGNGIMDLIRIQSKGTPEERDLLTSLRGFQLRSEVTLKGTRRAEQGDILITFVRWECRVKDRYDWDGVEHLTVVNPDYGSSAEGAVRPQDQKLTVYHSNAKRVEGAMLAAPYDVESTPWEIMDSRLKEQASVKPSAT